MNNFIDFTDYSGNIHKKTNEEIIKMDIKEYLFEVCDHKGYIRRNYNVLNEYYGDDIPSNIIERFKIDPYNDYILENMNSHDSAKLYNVLEKFFAEHGIFIMNLDPNQKDKSLITIIIPYTSNVDISPVIKAVVNSDELDTILKFYGYYITNHGFKVISGNEFYFIGIEPEYSENVNEFVYGRCFGQLYHITDSVNYDSIMSSGLKMRNGSNKKYRNFPKRIYFVAIDPARNKDILNSLNMKKAVRTFINRNTCKNISIFKIDLHGHNINFYTDDVARKMNGVDNCVYCYANIPANLIIPVYNGKIDPFMK